MKEFNPDYNNLIAAAFNRTPKRIPLYEHNISDKIMEQILNKKISALITGNKADKREYFKHYINFFKSMRYDTVSFECCVGLIMPDSGALGGSRPGVIKCRADFEKYPWETIPELYYREYDNCFSALIEQLPDGMKAVGGPGNGVFECVQDLVGYEQLCFISVDDPELYKELFNKVGKVLYQIWLQFLNRYGESYCVCRFGDDLGFKSNTLLNPDDIISLIIPEYKKIVNLVHSHKKPFLLHSCGSIFSVMEELIQIAGIDAKHSNEDQIAPFSTWIEKYGNRIGNFGGIDTDRLCSGSEEDLIDSVKDLYKIGLGANGFALGSGNSITDYVSTSHYIAMIETFHALREGFLVL